MTASESTSEKRSSAPLISVIIPCYRQAKYLPDAVHSLIGQAYPHWECVIVNDGSPDDTRAVAADLVRRDSRIRYVEQSNGGAASARNRGLAEVKGEFVQFLDADDLLLPENFTSGVATAGSSTGPCVVISDYWFMDESGRRFENHMCAPQFQFDTPLQDLALRWETELSFPPNAILFDARFFRTRGIRFSEALTNHEDWDCWMRIFRLRPIVRRVAQKHSVYRVHSESLTRSGDDKNWRGFRQAIDLQIELSSGDAELRRMLVYKRRLTDDFWGRSFRARILATLRKSRWFARVVPKAVRDLLYQRLDLSNLHAHGWL